MHSEEFELILVPSKDDAPTFGAEYQAELRLFSSKANATSQRAFAMDAVGGGGGPIGEFIFNNAGSLIAALTTIGVTWLRVRYGRKLKLKYEDSKSGAVKIEAHTIEEIEAMVKLLQAKKAK